MGEDFNDSVPLKVGVVEALEESEAEGGAELVCVVLLEVLPVGTADCGAEADMNALKEAPAVLLGDGVHPIDKVGRTDFDTDRVPLADGGGESEPREEGE